MTMINDALTNREESSSVRMTLDMFANNNRRQNADSLAQYQSHESYYATLLWLHTDTDNIRYMRAISIKQGVIITQRRKARSPGSNCRGVHGAATFLL